MNVEAVDLLEVETKCDSCQHYEPALVVVRCPKCKKNVCEGCETCSHGSDASTCDDLDTYCPFCKTKLSEGSEDETSALGPVGRDETP